MPASIAVPKFKSEREEAQWWDAHPEVVTALFLKARKERRIERLPRLHQRPAPSGAGAGKQDARIASFR